jgi:hypothetical protein
MDDDAHDQVRRDLADLGVDEASAPEVPAAVSARIGAALRAASDAPAHSMRRVPRWQRVALAAGACAAVVGAVIGVAMLTRDPAPAFSTGPTARSITRSATDLPLSNPQIVGLLSQRPDYGPLADPQRRASCLAGLGYPAGTAVLGARPVEMNGKPGVLIVLPADTPGTVLALVVDQDCDSAHTGLLANTLVTRP